jgi:hypothetical protein
LTAQQLDPLGGLTARLLVKAAVAIGGVVAVVMSIVTADETSRPALEVGALVAFGLAGWYFIRATSPFRPPFTLVDHMVVCLLLIVAVVLDAAAQWGTNSYVRDDWPVLALAIVTVAFGSYRPDWEIVVCAVVLSLFVGGLAALQAPAFDSDVPWTVYALLSATPVVAAGCGAASFSRSMVAALLEWRAGADAGDHAVEEADAAMRERASHLVHLDAEVIPFLERIAGGDEVTEADGGRARVLARELRTLMVMDAERSWLSRLAPRVVDDARVADRMTSAQRGYVRAVLAHIASSAVFDADSVSVEIEGAGPDGTARCIVRAHCVDQRSPRVQLAPYVAVARTVFAGVDMGYSASSVILALEFVPTATQRV